MIQICAVNLSKNRVEWLGCSIHSLYQIISDCLAETFEPSDDLLDFIRAYVWQRSLLEQKTNICPERNLDNLKDLVIKSGKHNASKSHHKAAVKYPQYLKRWNCLLTLGAGQTSINRSTDMGVKGARAKHLSFTSNSCRQAICMGSKWVKPWTRHTQAILKAEIISSLKFLESFEPAALSFEVFRLLRVPAFPFPFARVLYIVFLFFPISAKAPKARTRGWLRCDAKQ